jgi:isopenicillin-N N-acyltransferase like protein
VIARFHSPPAAPGERGEAFGAAHAAQVARTCARYEELFRDAAAGAGGQVVSEPDLDALGDEALAAIGACAPALAQEIEGIARGAGLPPRAVAAINARTEILARLGAAARGECSTVVALGEDDGPPVSVQTWDWHDLFADGWLLWTIEHPDGRAVHTVTEHGIVGKIGVNDRGVGLHVNILHHRDDGGPIGAPVHVLARAVLDGAGDVAEAATLLGAARTSASSVLTLVGAQPGEGGGKSALCAELHPGGPRFVLPERDGTLLHTNHFLDPHAAAGDRERNSGPDSWVRLDVLRRGLHAARRRRGGDATFTRDELLALLRSHVGGAGALCCHPAPGAPLGDRWETLVCVSLDPARGTLAARAGGPCNPDGEWIEPLATTTTTGA